MHSSSSHVLFVSCVLLIIFCANNFIYKIILFIKLFAPENSIICSVTMNIVLLNNNIGLIVKCIEKSILLTMMGTSRLFINSMPDDSIFGWFY